MQEDRRRHAQIYLDYFLIDVALGILLSFQSLSSCRLRFTKPPVLPFLTKGFYCINFVRTPTLIDVLFDYLYDAFRVKYFEEFFKETKIQWKSPSLEFKKEKVDETLFYFLAFSAALNSILPPSENYLTQVFLFPMSSQNFSSDGTVNRTYTRSFLSRRSVR